MWTGWAALLPDGGGTGQGHEVQPKDADVHGGQDQHHGGQVRPGRDGTQEAARKRRPRRAILVQRWPPRRSGLPEGIRRREGQSPQGAGRGGGGLILAGGLRGRPGKRGGDGRAGRSAADAPTLAAHGVRQQHPAHATPCHLPYRRRTPRFRAVPGAACGPSSSGRMTRPFGRGGPARQTTVAQGRERAPRVPPGCGGHGPGLQGRHFYSPPIMTHRANLSRLAQRARAPNGREQPRHSALAQARAAAGAHGAGPSMRR